MNLPQLRGKKKILLGQVILYAHFLSYSFVTDSFSRS